MDNVIVDARGKQCPIPVIETKKAFEAMGGKGSVKTLVDNNTAVENLKRFAATLGAKAEVSVNGENDYSIVITSENEINIKAADAETYSCSVEPPQKENKSYVVAFASDKLGSGDDELGALLIKGFIYTLSQEDIKPDKCVFFNGGAKLTTEGSPAVNDIAALEESGTEIITCGTCADFFGIKEKLAVGRIGNMYDIVEAMTSAGKVIRP